MEKRNDFTLEERNTMLIEEESCRVELGVIRSKEMKVPKENKEVMEGF